MGIDTSHPKEFTMSANERPTELSVELEHAFRSDDDDNVLVINKGNHHSVFEKLQPGQLHEITWVLTGNASNGEFCALNDAKSPGFTWLVTTPSEKVFHKLHPVGKNKLTIHNHHENKTSEGLWHYQLFASFEGKVYGVPLTFAAGSGSSPNPSIKNR
jgi:hypothetical protein